MAEAGQLRVPAPRNDPPLPDDGGASGSGNAPPPPVIADIIYPKNRPYSARLYKERTRTLLAATFCGAFVLTIVFSFAGAILGSGYWKPVRDWLQIMLPAETGLFGSALGFYFASRAGRRDDDD